MGADVRIAVIGGSGLYRFLTAAQTLDVETPYGRPSDSISMIEVAGATVAFLPRHGSGHTIPPHAINYRANLHALQSVGVTRVIAPAAVGSLQPEIAPGDVVICDQFIDRTWGRAGSFFDGPEVAHVSMSDPYCEEMRPLAARAAADAGFTVHTRGTVLVTQGPRFGTRAESRMHRQLGGDVVNMTQYPEVSLSRELGMCYVNVSVVTDYDAGLEEVPSREAVTQEQVMRVFAASLDRLRQSLIALIASAPEQRGCRCAEGAARPLHLS